MKQEKNTENFITEIFNSIESNKIQDIFSTNNLKQFKGKWVEGLDYDTVLQELQKENIMDYDTDKNGELDLQEFRILIIKTLVTCVAKDLVENSQSNVVEK